MRRIAAITAGILFVVVLTRWIPAKAQRDPLAPIVKENFGQPDRFRNERAAAGEVYGRASAGGAIDAQSRLSALSDELGREINSAINEELLTPEQADRLIKEIEVVFAIRLARVELMRLAKKLDKLQETSAGVPGSEELQRLRQKLEELRQLPEPGQASIGGIQKLE
jgi:hypothetical protein